MLVWYDIKDRVYERGSLTIYGDIEIEIVYPKKSNIMLECNNLIEELGSSKIRRCFEEISEKRLTFVEATDVEDG